MSLVESLLAGEQSLSPSSCYVDILRRRSVPKIKVAIVVITDKLKASVRITKCVWFSELLP